MLPALPLALALPLQLALNKLWACSPRPTRSSRHFSPPARPAQLGGLPLCSNRREASAPMDGGWGNDKPTVAARQRAVSQRAVNQIDLG
jgi:hypothetical protein